MSNLERPTLKSDFDNLPQETYAGLNYPTHRFADFIPVADDKDQYALRQSITDVGLLEPIVLFEGKILDGRHRFKACQVVGEEPRFTEFEGDEERALQFVLAKNVARRQLTTIQKLTLREKLQPEIARLKAAAFERMVAAGTPGQVLDEAPAGRVDEVVADMIGVSRTTQHQFDKVREIAAEQPEAQGFLDEMLAGNIGVEKAYKQARSVSADLDREAKVHAGPTPEKQRAELIAVIRKCRDLLLPYSVDLLGTGYVEELDDLAAWVNDAYDATN